MFSYIEGTIEDIDDNKLIVGCNGIGYELLVSNNTLSSVCIGQKSKLYVYMNVREDGVYLFGFLNKEEKKMFLKLITVSGVGPKVALSILSGMSIKDLIISIASGDALMLTKIKGVGKKMAERVILELSEKVQDDNLTQVLENIAGDAESEAISALLALGLSRSECQTSVLSAKALGAKTTEDIIGKALKSLGK